MAKHMNGMERKETIKGDIDSYLDAIENIPELHTKRKTHLCVHVVSKVMVI